MLISLVPSYPTQDRPDPKSSMPTPGQWKEPGYLQIRWYQSPNFGKRPHGVTDVDTIVVHSTVIPTLEATTGAFQRVSSQVSSHYTIGKDGSIVKNVSSFARAWHAGVSDDARHRNNVNDYSIGIELVNLNDGVDPYPEAQIAALRGIIAELRRRFGIVQIASHEYIANPQGRKSDPKNFPWKKLEDLGLPLFYGPKPTK